MLSIEFPTPEVWLRYLYLNLYDKEFHSHLKRNDRFSAFGVYLDLCGVKWIEHDHSPGVFYPEGATYWCASLPPGYLDQFGAPGQAYKNFHFFSQLSRMPFPHQAKQIEGYMKFKELL